VAERRAGQRAAGTAPAAQMAVAAAAAAQPEDAVTAAAGDDAGHGPTHGCCGH